MEYVCGEMAYTMSEKYNIQWGRDGIHNGGLMEYTMADK